MMQVFSLTKVVQPPVKAASCTTAHPRTIDRALPHDHYGLGRHFAFTAYANLLNLNYVPAR